MKIAILGAGAMGSRFGLMLKRNNEDVLLIDGWQDHINAIKENGLQANYNGEDISVEIPIANQKNITVTDKFDLLIVFTKAMQLDQMLKDCEDLVAPHTKVLCLLNGIGHEDIIKKYVSLDNIFIGNTMWTAGLIGPGKVKLFGSGSVELQNLGNNQEKQAQEIAEILSNAGLNAKYSENIRYSIYRKACVNGTMNGLCTILGVNMAELGKTTPAHDMVTAIVREFAAVAKEEGILLDIEEIIRHVEECFNPETIGLHFPSMYQDLINNHRLTEIDYINGAISRKGKKYHILTPYCDFLTQLIHAKEQIIIK